MSVARWWSLDELSIGDLFIYSLLQCLAALRFLLRIGDFKVQGCHSWPCQAASPPWGNWVTALLRTYPSRLQSTHWVLCITMKITWNKEGVWWTVVSYNLYVVGANQLIRCVSSGALAMTFFVVHIDCLLGKERIHYSHFSPKLFPFFSWLYDIMFWPQAGTTTF